MIRNNKFFLESRIIIGYNIIRRNIVTDAEKVEIG